MSVLLHTVMLVGVLAGTGQSDPVPVIPELLNKLIYTPPKPIPVSPLTTDHHGLVFGVESTGLPPIPAHIDPVDPVIDLGSIPITPARPGRVEAQSIVVVNSSHAQFERAVRDAIPGMRFTPAEVRGVRVRQLVEQSFGFELKR